MKREKKICKEEWNKWNKKTKEKEVVDVNGILMGEQPTSMVYRNKYCYSTCIRQRLKIAKKKIYTKRVEAVIDENVILS